MDVAARHGQTSLLKLKWSIRMGEQGDLNASERAMFVGSKWIFLK